MSSIVISGIGVISPLGDTPEKLFSALLKGSSAIKPSSAVPGLGTAEIEGFDPTQYANVRGMRMYNRATQLAICSTKLALQDAGFDPSTPGEDVGLMMASTYGHLDVLLDYDRSLVQNGVQRTNGALMPMAIPSAPGAMVALSIGAKAFSITLSDNAGSFLDALALAQHWLEDGRAKVCVVVGAFSPSQDMVLAAARAGFLASPETFRIYDRENAGTTFGEGSVAFVLERQDGSKKIRAHGKLVRHSATFSGSHADSSGLEGAVTKAAESVLGSAGVGLGDLALVVGAGSGVPELDHAEARALAAVLKQRTRPIPVTSVKGVLGILRIVRADSKPSRHFGLSGIRSLPLSLV